MVLELGRDRAWGGGRSFNEYWRMFDLRAGDFTEIYP